MAKHNTTNSMHDPIRTEQTNEGTELVIRERDDGQFEVAGRGEGRMGDPLETREAAERELEESARLIDRGDRAKRQTSPQQRGGFGGGGLFGGGMTERDSGSDGGLFGGGMTERDSDGGGGLFGGGSRERDTTRRERDDSGGGGFFASFGGGSRSGRRERDADSGRFAPTQRDPVDFEMERDSRGRFSGRADDEQDGSSGFLGGLFR